MSPNIETISSQVIDTAFHIHIDLGPGLLESVYEALLARRLIKLGLKTERQKPVPFEFDGVRFDEGFRADLVIEDVFLVELKSVETLTAVHGKQLLTYLRLMKLPLGLLINFGNATFKEGIKRIVNQHIDFTSSQLRLHKTV